jgi:hypothetical protein
LLPINGITLKGIYITQKERVIAHRKDEYVNQQRKTFLSEKAKIIESLEGRGDRMN